LSPTTAGHVRESFGDAVECILDGGPCQVGIESTVVSLAGDQPVLLRPGMITIEQLEDALQCKLDAVPEVEGAHPSPGMHRKHYAPRTALFLLRDGHLPPGRGAYLWIAKPADAELAIPMPSDAANYARILYDALHRADQAHLDWIAVEMPPLEAAWSAVHDRLSRACSHS
jgi:L-threonylcarbamoyladenylate synthase